MITGQFEFSFTHIAELFLIEALGGILFGLLIGYLSYKLLATVDNYQVEIMMTVAVAFSGYVLASALHLSAPLAIVVAGLFLGNHGRSFAMKEKTVIHLDNFWELIDEFLNAILFVLIGLEIFLLSYYFNFFIVSLIAILVVLFARLVSISIPISIYKFFRSFSPNAIQILTWSGLRGGISIALALSIPIGFERDLILSMTYMVVVFSIVVQGLTLKRLLD